jgi:hypothetical protein
MDERIIELIRTRLNEIEVNKEFSLKELLVDEWELIENKNSTGKEFKQMVNSSQFNNIRHRNIESNNSNKYIKIN